MTDLSVRPRCLFVIFGATGDLTKRKLLPAIYQLKLQGQLPDQFAVIATARKEYTDESYREIAKEAVTQYSGSTLKEEIWESLCKQLFYHQLQFDEDDGYAGLKVMLEGLDDQLQTNGNHIFYLAVAPEYFGEISDRIEKFQLINQDRGWYRLMIEKPFGNNLESARELNSDLTRVFREENLYRIDHYLVKEMVRNLMVIRASNQIFEPLWNGDYIDHIEIISMESEGIGLRGRYYDKSGALRDMVQNHLLQMLALTAMEMPDSLSTTKVRTEKVKMLRALIPIDEDQISNQVVLGQYEGYLDEERVKADSPTETFAALKVCLDHPRWRDVPFYLKTGKAVVSKMTQINIQFKRPLGTSYLGDVLQSADPNRLIIKIQPDEGFEVVFNTKKPGTLDSIMPVSMDFCQSCLVEQNTPEAYEKLILDCINGDASSFTHWDELEATWTWIDKITDWAYRNPQEVRTYPKGSEGPEAAEELLKRSKDRDKK
jgi:glucose-6-phosphate 1-dehydrogenase